MIIPPFSVRAASSKLNLSLHSGLLDTRLTVINQPNHRFVSNGSGDRVLFSGLNPTAEPPLTRPFTLDSQLRRYRWIGAREPLEDRKLLHIDTSDAVKGMIPWDIPLSTNSLWGCAGLVIVNPVRKTHYLAHVNNVDCEARDNTVDDDEEKSSAIARGLLETVFLTDRDISESLIYLVPNDSIFTGKITMSIGATLKALDKIRPGLAQDTEKVFFVDAPKNPRALRVDIEGACSRDQAWGRGIAIHQGRFYLSPYHDEMSPALLEESYQSPYYLKDAFEPPGKPLWPYVKRKLQKKHG